MPRKGIHKWGFPCSVEGQGGGCVGRGGKRMVREGRKGGEGRGEGGGGKGRGERRGGSSQVWKVLKKSAESKVIAEKAQRKNQYRDSTVLTSEVRK
jgi:hypothetical protein